MESFEESIEITKLLKDNAHVYKLPPIMTSTGTTADDFTVKDLVFRGNLKVTVKGEMCIIYFINENEEIPFLVSLIDCDFEKIVQQVTGSTRYFTIKAMTLDKVQGIYGIAFKQRSDAFDFYNTLVEYKEKLLFERSLKSKVNVEYKPKYDLDNIETTGENNLLIKKQEVKVETKGLSKFKFGDPTKK